MVFLDSYNAHDDVIISNSIFEDINIKSLYPMFSVENMNLKYIYITFLFHIIIISNNILKTYNI